MNKKIKKEVEKISNSFGITSLWTGISGLILFMAPYIAIFLSIMSIIFGVLQNKKMKTGTATAGIVLGIIGVVLNAIMLFFILMVFIFAPGMIL